MTNKLNLQAGNDISEAYFGDNLLNEKRITKIIHNHRYSEIHIISRGKAVILVGNKRYTVSAGNAYSIPSEVYHCFLETSEDIEIFTYQVTFPLKDFSIRKIPDSVTRKIVHIVTHNEFRSNCSELSALLSLATSYFAQPIQIGQSRDYALIIREFISENYNRSVKVSELSRQLCLCDRQTERLVIKYTGYTFRQAVVNYRMRVAAFLEKSTEMSKSEIAAYVGYSNYSGFWKGKNSYKATVSSNSSDSDFVSDSLSDSVSDSVSDSDTTKAEIAECDER